MPDSLFPSSPGPGHRDDGTISGVRRPIPGTTPSAAVSEAPVEMSA